MESLPLDVRFDCFSIHDTVQMADANELVASLVLRLGHIGGHSFEWAKNRWGAATLCNKHAIPLANRLWSYPYGALVAYVEFSSLSLRHDRLIRLL